MLTPVQLRAKFVEVRNLLTLSQRWVQGFMAKDFEGRPVKALDSRAVAWCLSGAISKVCDDEHFFGDGGRMYVAFFAWLKAKKVPTTPVLWNDSWKAVAEKTAHEKMLAGLDEFIATL